MNCIYPSWNGKTHQSHWCKSLTSIRTIAFTFTLQYSNFLSILFFLSCCFLYYRESIRIAVERIVTKTLRSNILCEQLLFASALIFFLRIRRNIKLNYSNKVSQPTTNGKPRINIFGEKTSSTSTKEKNNNKQEDLLNNFVYGVCYIWTNENVENAENASNQT